jgi:hypothetical protein
MLAEAVGRFKKLVCLVEIARVANEAERTKVGERFLFHFTSSKAAL